jgi:cytochrome c biogenesis protein CcmG/thiol:disulfide interchange protein DsbE
MNKNKILSLFIAGFMVLLLAGTVSCSDDRQPPVVPKAAEGKARDFVLKDLSGKKFLLSETRGKPVLIIFSTTWCPTCRSEIPFYKKIHDTYAARGLVMINVDIQEQLDKVSRFAERYQLPYRVLLDDEGLVAKAYQIVGVPTMILLDQNGALISRQYQAIDGLLEKLFRDS